VNASHDFRVAAFVISSGDIARARRMTAGKNIELLHTV
jgi:hypothetical protein